MSPILRLPHIVAVALALSAGNANVRSAEPLAGNDETLKVIAETYARNRNRFTAFTCTFQVIEGTSKTIEDAIAGRIDRKLIRNGLWIVGPDEMRYELDCPPGTSTLTPPTIPPSESNSRAFTTIDCMQQVELWGRKSQVAVSISSVLGVVNLKEKSTYSATLNPLSLGVMGRGEVNSPAALIEGGRAGSRRCRYTGELEHDGVNVAVMETAMRETDFPQPVLTWYLDRARGAFPVRILFRDTDGKLEGETRTLAIKQIPNAGFIAEQFLQTWTRDEGVAVIRVTLTDLKLGVPLRGQLAVTVSPGIQVVDVSDMRSVFRTTGAETIYADEIEQWQKRCKASLQERLKEQ
jgi:hypothetical protein